MELYQDELRPIIIDRSKEKYEIVSRVAYLRILAGILGYLYPRLKPVFD